MSRGGSRLERNNFKERFGSVVNNGPGGFSNRYFTSPKSLDK
jgi:hypothetical protein